MEKFVVKYEIIFEEEPNPQVIIRVLEGTPPENFVRLPSGDGVEFQSDKKLFIGPKRSLPDYKVN